MLQGSCANVYISTEVASHENCCYFNTVSELRTFMVQISELCLKTYCTRETKKLEPDLIERSNDYISSFNKLLSLFTYINQCLYLQLAT